MIRKLLFPDSKGISFIVFSLVLLILAVINGLCFTYLNKEFFHFKVDVGWINSLSKFELFFFLIIIGPLIETSIFQYLVIESMLNTKADKLTIVFTSATIFAVTHWYFWLYTIMAFIVGIILSGLYLTSRRIGISPFFTTFTFHLIYNLIGFVLF